jgi:hypothetical protein
LYFYDLFIVLFSTVEQKFELTQPTSENFKRGLATAVEGMFARTASEVFQIPFITIRTFSKKLYIAVVKMGHCCLVCVCLIFTFSRHLWFDYLTPLQQTTRQQL